MSSSTLKDLSKLDKQSLIDLCKKLNIKGYSGKNKQQLIELIELIYQVPSSPVALPVALDSHASPVESPVTIGSQTPIKFIDLFCGVGGFHQALKRLGGICVFACDIDEHCRQVYANNYGLTPHNDITKVVAEEVPDFDVLCAGFPCQAFSNAGNKKNFSDSRGTLFEHILRIAVSKRPKFLFLENVKHIKKICDGEVFKHILKRIVESGYYVKDEETIFELSPHQLGIPQHRERVIFSCIRQDIYNPAIPITLVIPDLSSVTGSLEKIVQTDKTVTDKYKIEPEVEEVLSTWDKMVQVIEPGDSMSPTILCNEFTSTYSEAEYAALPAWKQEYIEKNRPIYNKYKPQWDEWVAEHAPILTKKEIYGKLEWQAGKKKEGDSIWNYFIQMRQSGIRVKKCDYFPTLVAIVQTPIYAKERRYITPRECARLQSFPDDFIMHVKDKIAYKQFGNAVNVDVVHFVINRVLTAYGVAV
jgi:DNA (cytosine-5)-methyltransferase 1